ncbi:LysM peptidoglycan-binding domain-containing protein, partial [Vibrio parahaemolyticus]|nr:LysM peptidoglycan-binding domain-containing protein [Vibrio parahaemolyticus]
MNKLLRHIGISFVFAAGLVGCAAHSPAPVSSLKKDYASLERGSYRGSYYEVKKGDTLYFIAYVTDKDVNDVVRYNELTQPYTIYPGQRLKLW